LHRRDDRRVDGVQVIDAPDHDGAREPDHVGGGAKLVALVSQRDLRVLRGPLDLEQHPQRKLATAPPPARARSGRRHAKATSLTKTLTSSTRRASIRAMAWA